MLLGFYRLSVRKKSEISSTKVASAEKGTSWYSLLLAVADMIISRQLNKGDFKFV
jgi:hypothetical protein